MSFSNVFSFTIFYPSLNVNVYVKYTVFLLLDVLDSICFYKLTAFSGHSFLSI